MSQCPLDYETTLLPGQRPTGVLLAEQRLKRLRAHLWTNDLVARACRATDLMLSEFCAVCAGQTNPDRIREIWNKDDYWPLIYGKQFTECWNAFLVLKHDVEENHPIYDPTFYSEKARHNQRTITRDLYLR